MPGALLRTGNLREFKALGVDGQPVYSAALQLREAIRLKMGPEAASCLAIPQPNETGDRIDWYAPLEGDVVPWSAATAEERAHAYTQLEAMHAQLGNTSTTMRSDAQSREKQIFGRLLEKTVNFPDSDHIYLVDGKPVISFWGFTDHAGTYDHDPLLCLRPPVPSTAVTPLAPPPLVAAVPVETVEKSRWWRWLWLLLLPLLLLLLLFLLRACAPTVELPLGLDRIDLPGLPAVEVRDINATGYSGAVDSDGRALDGQSADGLELPAAEVVDQGAPTPDDSATPALEPTPPPADEAAEQEPPAELPQEQPQDPAQEQPQNEPPQEPPQPREQPPGRDVPQDLSIPPQALETGSTEFLNGNWNAGAGIQDAQTGKPMQLDYDFKDGKGQVKVRRGDGVECTGAVSAAMQGGKLAINNQGQAACNDGSSYKLPDVVCSPEARSAADCTGSYENKQFPMSMRQAAQ